MLSIAFEPKLPDSISIFRPSFIALFAYVKCSSFLKVIPKNDVILVKGFPILLAECITNSA